MKNSKLVILDKENLLKDINHPVHIVQKNNDTFSPSAFIPFCSFGGDRKILGTQIDSIDIPVCNSFSATIHNNQQCYQIDLNKYKSVNGIEEQLGRGLELILDYNEDRQLNKVEGFDNTFTVFLNASKKMELIQGYPM